MLVQVRPKKINAAKKIEDVLVANEYTASFGLRKYIIQFVQAALGDHVHMWYYPMSFRVSYRIDIEVPGAKQNSRCYLGFLHG